MRNKEILLNKKINGIGYTIYSFKVGGEYSTTMHSSIPINGLTVDEIKYSEETKTFQMTDFINVWGRKIKIMFNIGLDMKIKGFIYNDFEESYEEVAYEDSEPCSSDATERVYQQYLVSLQERLTNKFAVKEREFYEKNLTLLNPQNNQ